MTKHERDDGGSRENDTAELAVVLPDDLDRFDSPSEDTPASRAPTASATLFGEESLLSVMVEVVAEAVMVLRAVRNDPGRVVDFEVVIANPASQVALQRTEAELIGRRLGVEVPVTVRLGLLDRYISVVETGRTFEHEFAMASPGGDRWFILRAARYESDGVDGLVVAFRETTDVQETAQEVTGLRRRQRTLEKQALQDPLTGLANRTLLHSRLEHGLSRLERRIGSIAVLFIDLDGFKEVNDQRGHAVGDQLLVEIASRLAGAARPYDTVARLGGDEFVVVCEEINSELDLEGIARRLVRVCSTPVVISGTPISVSASIGVAVATTPHIRASQLIIDADEAMYRSKSIGGGRVSYADHDLGERMTRRHAASVRLIDAVLDGRLDVAFDPIVDALTGSVAGVDATIRWNHPEDGVINHEVLTGVAKDSNCLRPLFEWFIGQAIAEFAHWTRTSPTAPPLMVVNVDEQILADERFIAAIATLLEQHDLAPARLCVAVDMLTSRPDLILRPLQSLAELGVKIMRDRVGASSKVYFLPGYPIHMVRLDAAFVASATDSDELRTVHTIAAHLDKLIVIPAITSPTQYATLRELGAGYLHGPYVTSITPLGGVSTPDSRAARLPS